MITPTLNTITVEDAKIRLEDLVARARQGEEWFITDTSGQPVARLEAPSANVALTVSPGVEHAPLIGLMRGQIELLPGWDDPLEEFEPYS